MTDRWLTVPTLGTHGRLGNQLWQIAAAYCHARRNDAELRLPLWEYRSQFPELERHGVTFHRTLRSTGLWAEPRWTFDALPPYWDGMGLHGYWQSPQYWGEMAGVVRDIFQPLPKPEADPGLCTVHVRRGDYVRLPDYHVMQSREWYERAMARATERGATKFVICSDDPVWCAREWPALEVSQRTEVHDLALMARSAFNILAASSLSWWGAWLGGQSSSHIHVGPVPGADGWMGAEQKNHTRLIIAPLRWFGPALAANPVEQLDPGEGWEWID